MVHQIINTSSNNAPSDSSNNSHMRLVWFSWLQAVGPRHPWAAGAIILGLLAGCATPDQPSAPPEATVSQQATTPAMEPPADRADWQAWLAWDATVPLPVAKQQPSSRWVAAHWRDLPGVGQDSLDGLWQAWLRSCQQQRASFCSALQLQQLAEPGQRWQWLIEHWQPYAVQTDQGQDQGLLTGYFEPELQLRRARDGAHQVPLYALPHGWQPGQRWHTRQVMDLDPALQQALADKVIAWAADPIEALVLQIQGSGRATITEPDGSQRRVRLAFAGHNGHPYRSIGRWLLDQGETRDGSWDGITAWVRAHPQRLQSLLWVNPRVVFFREEPLAPQAADIGPRGAQGVPLTPRRSVAVDPNSVPYGTALWLQTEGVALSGARMVVAQDTGGAIVGAVRADFFTGWGQAAKDTAYQLKQRMRWWALLPRTVPLDQPTSTKGTGDG